MHHNLNSKGSSAQRCGKGLIRSRIVPGMPRISKRKFQEHGPADRSGKLAQERNPPSAERRAAGLAPFRLDLAKRAALGINPKYLNSSPGKRSGGSRAWMECERLWDIAAQAIVRAEKDGS